MESDLETLRVAKEAAERELAELRALLQDRSRLSQALDALGGGGPPEEATPDPPLRGSALGLSGLGTAEEVFSEHPLGNINVPGVDHNGDSAAGVPSTEQTGHPNIRISSSPAVRDHLKSVFDQVDQGSKGYLSAPDFSRACVSVLKLNLSPEEAERVYYHLVSGHEHGSTEQAHGIGSVSSQGLSLLGFKSAVASR